MFEGIQRGLGEALKKLRGRGRITEANVREGMQEVRKALLDADVNLHRRQRLHRQRVTERSLGQEVLRTLDPSEQIVKIVYDELVALMGPVDTSIHFAKDRPTVIMLCGLQGQGKTTTAGKLALTLRETRPQAAARRRRLAAPRRRRSAQSPRRADQRPGLQRDSPANPVDVCRNAVAHAKKNAARYRHPRHRRPAARRRDADGRAAADRPPRQAGRGVSGLRRHDRPGRRQQCQGVQRGAGAERRHPDQDGRRRPRRRGPVDQGGRPRCRSSSSASARSWIGWRSFGPRAWPSASSARAT